MDMEFKKGDRVKSVCYNFTGGMTGTILGFSDEFIAVEFDKEYRDLHDCSFCNPEFNGKAHRCYYILPKALILLNSKIHITFNGLTTTAEYGGKTATAKCNPTDTFDNYIGAKIALDRLFGKEENTVREGKQSKPKKYNFYVGQRVRIKTWEQLAKEFALTGSGNINCRCVFLTTMKQYCGAEQPPTRKEIEQDEKAELERIEKIERKQKKDELKEAGQSLEALRAYGYKMGYAPGWAFNRWQILKNYKERYGR